MRKPVSTTAMSTFIESVKQAMLLDETENFACGAKGDCIGCPKKLLKLVDNELRYWENAIERGVKA